MPTFVAVAVGVTPVTWTVCGLWLLARKASPAVPDGRATAEARPDAGAPTDGRAALVPVPLAA